MCHDFDDIHLPDHHGDEGQDDDAARDDLAWLADNVELTTVGIDVGSSTSHLMFSRIRLSRLSDQLSSRFVVVRRETLYRSPILLTPYVAGNEIDAAALGRFIADSYAQAGLSHDTVDSGAVILTGEALKRKNAPAIADLFAEQAGRFVCASAGHNLEAILAAHGAGAVARSRAEHVHDHGDGHAHSHGPQMILSVDVGGGTSKLAYCRNGQVLDTAAIGVGGRLVAFGSDGRVVRLEAEARQVADALGIPLALGEPLAEEQRRALARALAGALLRLIRGEPLDALGERLMLTPRPEARPRVDGVIFSGGVSEYIYGRETADYGDLAPYLAAELRAAVDGGQLPGPLAEPGERIRATVIGASQFTVQLSGNTVTISNPALLPVHNVPVLRPDLDADAEPTADVVAAAIRRSFQRVDLAEGAAPAAIAISWDGLPYYRALRALADGIVAALPETLRRGVPLLVVFDGDVGRTVGEILRGELGVTNDVICIDGVRLSELDYVDVGRIVEPADVVPVVIKSLIFPQSAEEEALLPQSAASA
jgi:ethanolamine utilization protein EutA